MTAWAHEGTTHSPILAAISVEPDSARAPSLVFSVFWCRNRLSASNRLVPAYTVRLMLRDYDIRSVVVHPTKRADFSRHGYRAAQFEDGFARFLPHEPNIRTLKRGGGEKT